MRLAADALAPGLGGCAELRLVHSGQFAIIEQLFAPDPQVFYAIAAGGVDQLRYRVINRLLGQPAQVESYQVGGFARLD